MFSKLHCLTEQHYKDSEHRKYVCHVWHKNLRGKGDIHPKMHQYVVWNSRNRTGEIFLKQFEGTLNMYVHAATGCSSGSQWDSLQKSIMIFPTQLPKGLCVMEYNIVQRKAELICQICHGYLHRKKNLKCFNRHLQVGCFCLQCLMNWHIWKK